jgi:hypothetical protein
MTSAIVNPGGGTRCAVCHEGRARRLVQLPGTVRLANGQRVRKFLAACDTCAARLTAPDSTRAAAAA